MGTASIPSKPLDVEMDMNNGPTPYPCCCLISFLSGVEDAFEFPTQPQLFNCCHHISQSREFCPHSNCIRRPPIRSNDSTFPTLRQRKTASRDLPISPFHLPTHSPLYVAPTHPPYPQLPAETPTHAPTTTFTVTQPPHCTSMTYPIIASSAQRRRPSPST